MGTWQKRHYEAIADYAKKNGYRMAMGRFPNAQFVDKNGEQITKHINDILVEYQISKNDEAKERKRLKNEEERNKPWQERFKQR